MHARHLSSVPYSNRQARLKCYTSSIVKCFFAHRRFLRSKLGKASTQSADPSALSTTYTDVAPVKSRPAHINPRSLQSTPPVAESPSRTPCVYCLPHTLAWCGCGSIEAMRRVLTAFTTFQALESASPERVPESRSRRENGSLARESLSLHTPRQHRLHCGEGMAAWRSGSARAP